MKIRITFWFSFLFFRPVDPVSLWRFQLMLIGWQFPWAALQLRHLNRFAGFTPCRQSRFIIFTQARANYCPDLSWAKPAVGNLHTTANEKPAMFSPRHPPTHTLDTHLLRPISQPFWKQCARKFDLPNRDGTDKQTGNSFEHELLCQRQMFCPFVCGQLHQPRRSNRVACGLALRNRPWITRALPPAKLRLRILEKSRSYRRWELGLRVIICGKSWINIQALNSLGKKDPLNALQSGQVN